MTKRSAHALLFSVGLALVIFVGSALDRLIGPPAAPVSDWTCAQATPGLPCQDINYGSDDR